MKNIIASHQIELNKQISFIYLTIEIQYARIFTRST